MAIPYPVYSSNRITQNSLSSFSLSLSLSTFIFFNNFISKKEKHTQFTITIQSFKKLSSMAISLAIGLRSAFMVLGCVTAATVIYTVATDGLPFRKELLTPWMAATLIDFYIIILAIGAWIVYKESNWIRSLIWIVLLICFGSITACGYIVMQFLKLSPQESLQDPIYFVLLKNTKKDGTESKSIISVVVARVIFSLLGCVMLGTLIYTIATDGSPFRRELLTPWMIATLVDFYVNIIALSVWVAYKESNYKTAALWIVLFICFGSVSVCAYIVVQFFHLASQDPVYLVLFSSSSRAVNGREGGWLIA